MLISDLQARKLLAALYHTAEKAKNDVIANAASALAVRLEAPKKEHKLADTDIELIKYAVSISPQTPELSKARRKTYKRRVSLA